MDISGSILGVDAGNSIPQHIVETVSCDTKMFAVLLMEVFLSLIGAALCVLTMVLLLRFNVFHVNQRILIANVALIVLFGCFYASLRAVIAIYQCGSMSTPLSSSVGMDNERIAACYLRDSISPAIAIAIVMSGLCIAIERLYATLNFAVYEYQEMSYVVNTACLVTLLPIVFYVIGFLVSLCTSKVELTFSCANLTDGDYIKENIVYIIAAFFDIIFLALYIILYFDNKSRQVEYIRDHYDSFSSRFQINENIKSTRLLFPFNIAFLFLLIFMIFTTETYNDDRLLESNQAVKEMRNLIYPLFTIIFPLSYIYRCPIFYSKARTVAAEMLFPYSKGKHQRLEAKKSRRLSSLLSEKQRTHFEVLIASWEEDAMKMQ